MASKELNSEQELFHLIAEGNEDAFNQLYFRLLPDFTPYIFKMVKSELAVKEVIQEALIRFWLSRYKLPGISQPKAWLFRIIANECYRWLKKHGLQQRLTLQLDSQPAPPDSLSLHQTEMDVSFRETQQIIAQTVTALSPRQKTIYRLSREEGLTIPEIAQQLGLSSNYVKKTLMLALHIIREKLIETGRFLPMILILLSK